MSENKCWTCGNEKELVDITEMVRGFGYKGEKKMLICKRCEDLVHQENEKVAEGLRQRMDALGARAAEKQEEFIVDFIKNYEGQPAKDKQEWTKEPWQAGRMDTISYDADDPETPYKQIYVDDPKGEMHLGTRLPAVVAKAFDALGADCRANASRIEQCVNALVGIRNPAALGTLLNEANWLAEYAGNLLDEVGDMPADAQEVYPSWRKVYDALKAFKAAKESVQSEGGE